MDFNFYYPDNIKKYIGKIIKRGKKCVFQVRNKKYDFMKEFFHRDYPSKEEAYADAIKCKRKWNIEHDTVVNKYMKGDKCLLVHLNKDEEYMKIEPGHLDIVDKYNWRIQNRIEHPSTCMCDDTGRKKYVTFPELAYGSKHIYQLNGDKMDFTKGNVHIITQEMLHWIQSNSGNKRKENSLSGISGIYKVRTGDYEYWQVNAKNCKGKEILKKFSFRKYGEMGAKNMAINYKTKYIDTAELEIE